MKVTTQVQKMVAVDLYVCDVPGCGNNLIIRESCSICSRDICTAHSLYHVDRELLVNDRVCSLCLPEVKAILDASKLAEVRYYKRMESLSRKVESIRKAKRVAFKKELQEKAGFEEEEHPDANDRVG